jgi:hypothetical protein
MVKDPAYLADMAKLRYEVSFIPARESERLIKRVYAFPPAIVERMKVAITNQGKLPAR